MFNNVKIPFDSTASTLADLIERHKYDADDIETDRMLTKLEQRIREWHVALGHDDLMAKRSATSRPTSSVPQASRMRRINRSVRMTIVRMTIGRRRDGQFCINFCSEKQ